MPTFASFPSMKKVTWLLSVCLIALLLGGCGGEGSSDTKVESKEPELAGGIDLDDPETRKKILAEALEVDVKTLSPGVMAGVEPLQAPNQQTPYTGWVKPMLPNGNGQVGLIQFKDGKPHGLGVSWYENGRKMTENNFKDGKREGLMTQWYESGQKRTEANFKGGNEHGLVTEWHENGQKRWEGNWKNGQQDGLDTTWYENGQKKRESTYEDGELISEKSWDKDGNPQE